MKAHQVKRTLMEDNWTGDCLNGRWNNLLHLTGSDLAESLAVRARLMRGDLVDAPFRTTKDPWVKINDDICRFYYRLMSARTSAALYYANKAFVRAKRELPELLPDAGFCRALGLAEVGQKFEALALYSQLRKSKKLSLYRKNLILINEALNLWDLGLIDPLKEISNEIPEPFGTRMRLMLDLLEGNFSVVERHLKKLSVYCLVPQNEKENLLLILLEAILVFGRQENLEDLKKTLFYNDIIHSSKSPLIRFVETLLNDKDPGIQLKGRDQVDGKFIQALYYSHRDPESASEKGTSVYKNELLFMMKNESIYSPFIPTEAICQSPRNNWESAIAARIFKKVTLRRLDMDARSKSLIYENNTVSFVKSPVTWKLIVEFVSRRRLKKEEIHAILTNNRYRASLHDSRIFKLVHRINSKTKKSFGFEVCQFNGSNELEIHCQLTWKTR